MTKNTLQTQNNQVSLSDYCTIPAVRKKIIDIIGGDRGPQFIASLVTSVNQTPALADCDYNTLLAAALTGAALELSPSPQLGQFYMVPYNDNRNGRKTAQFQMGYKGYIQLAMRSGQYKKLNVVSIKEGELKFYDPLNEEVVAEIIENPEQREKAETVGYYAMFELINGFRKGIYWSKAQMQQHGKKYSKAYNSNYSFWQKDFDSMAHKTMLRQLISKWGPMSIDFQMAFEKDMGIIQEDGTVDYIDITPTEIEEPMITEPTDQAKQSQDQQQEIEDYFFG